MSTVRYHCVIPVYRPDNRLLKLLYALEHQTCPPAKVTLMHTRVPGEDAGVLDRARERYPLLDIVDLKKTEFDHAATRNAGAARSDGADMPYVLFMTQDAVPRDKETVAHLIDALQVQRDGAQVAAVYARQVAGKDAPIEERCLRAFNYPAQSYVRTFADLDTYGMKTFFCSNVCAMYDRTVFDKEGPFSAPALFNEDMVYAATVMQKGYAVAYAAEAVVFHAHHDTLKQRFLRSAQMGRSQAAHRDIFANVSSEREGFKLVRYTVRTMFRAGQAHRIPLFFLQCAARYAGYLYGKLIAARSTYGE